MTRAEEIANMLLCRVIVDWPEREWTKGVIVDHILFAQKEERQRCAEVCKSLWGAMDCARAIEKLEDA